MKNKKFIDVKIESLKDQMNEKGKYLLKKEEILQELSNKKIISEEVNPKMFKELGALKSERTNLLYDDSLKKQLRYLDVEKELLP